MKKSYYAIIPATIRYDKRITNGAKLLYGEITALCNQEGYCWASNSYFAKLYEVSNTTISTWISQLEKNQYITRKIIYKEGTKEIEGRYLSLFNGGMQENLNTPIQENLKGNTTSLNNTKEYIPYVEIIDYLNQKANKKYMHTTNDTRKKIRARWNEGHRLDNFKKVIDVCCREWKGKIFNNGTPGDRYLRPSTLFNEKFEDRLNLKFEQKQSTAPVKTKEQLEHERMVKEMGLFND